MTLIDLIKTMDDDEKVYIILNDGKSVHGELDKVMPELTEADLNKVVLQVWYSRVYNAITIGVDE